MALTIRVIGVLCVALLFPACKGSLNQGRAGDAATDVPLDKTSVTEGGPNDQSTAMDVSVVADTQLPDTTGAEDTGGTPDTGGGTFDTGGGTPDTGGTPDV